MTCNKKDEKKLKQHLGVVQCDCWAYSLHLWTERPSHGCGHSLLLFFGHPTCGSQQLACWSVYQCQQQRCEPAVDTSHTCHVPSGRHALSSWQVTCSSQVTSSMLCCRVSLTTSAELDCIGSGVHCTAIQHQTCTQGSLGFARNILLLLIPSRLHVPLLLVVTSCLPLFRWACTANAPAVQAWVAEMQMSNIGFWG